MNKQNWTILVIALLLMGGTGVVLARLRATQRLGAPGVKTSSIAGSPRLQVDLPEQVLNYDSKAVPTDKMVLDFLPQDTSFGQRVYLAPDKFWVQVNVVLMGADRTSIHKPQYCLAGFGFNIDNTASSEATVHIERPHPYDLPVMKLIATKEATIEGKKVTVRGVYVYWFVADDQLTAQHNQRMWWMARDVIRTGVLQRWAYVSYFAYCMPGAEEQTFERMKKLIAASVPEFQLTPRPESMAISAKQ
jgi:hypothetical protein